MTFDDVDDYIDERVLMEDTSSECIEKDDVIDLIYKLIKEYAPTIEMTEMQMKQMMSFKEVNAGFSTFMYKQGLGQVPYFSDFITTQRENELMQACLHQDTIKVVD